MGENFILWDRTKIPHWIDGGHRLVVEVPYFPERLIADVAEDIRDRVGFVIGGDFDVTFQPSGSRVGYITITADRLYEASATQLRNTIDDAMAQGRGRLQARVDLEQPRVGPWIRELRGESG